MVFLLSTVADARRSGSFRSPARNTLAVKWLQLDGTSHIGGGSFTICQTDDVSGARAAQMGGTGEDTHLQTQRMRVVARPGSASVQHVQQHATAAPHICFGAERVSTGHFGGHVGLGAGEDASYSNISRK